MLVVALLLAYWRGSLYGRTCRLPEKPNVGPLYPVKQTGPVAFARRADDSVGSSSDGIDDCVGDLRTCDIAVAFYERIGKKVVDLSRRKPVNARLGE